MNLKHLAGLLALNGILLAALITLSLSKPAQAQLGSASNYLMIAAQTNARPNSTVYILDPASSYMLAVGYDEGRKQLVPQGVRLIDQDLTAARPR